MRSETIDIARLVDTSTVVEAGSIDPSSLARKPLYCFAKRVFDIAASVLALIVLAIPMLIIALLIKADSPGPVFYRQERLGKDGVSFDMVKFRTMEENAEREGARWTSDDDPRVTRLGRTLRAYHLDELPQFFQVVTGKLSLVGPRPERSVFHNEFMKYINGFDQRLLVKPGLTGLAQVSGGYDLRPAEKLEYDLEYIQNRSILLDLKILLRTVHVVLSREGAR